MSCAAIADRKGCKAASKEGRGFRLIISIAALWGDTIAMAGKSMAGDTWWLVWSVRDALSMRVLLLFLQVPHQKHFLKYI